MPHELVEIGEYPHINAAGVAAFQELGDGRGRFIMFDWFKLDGIWRRCVVGMVTRQLATIAWERENVYPTGHPVLTQLSSPGGPPDLH